MPNSEQSHHITRSISIPSISSSTSSTSLSSLAAFASQYPYFQYLTTQMPLSIIKAFYTNYLYPDLKAERLYTSDKQWYVIKMN